MALTGMQHAGKVLTGRIKYTTFSHQNHGLTLSGCPRQSGGALLLLLLSLRRSGSAVVQLELLSLVLLCLQGDEERKHRPGSGNGGKEDQKLADVLGGPGPDGEGRRGAPQPDCEASSTPSLRVTVAQKLCSSSASRTVRRSWRRTWLCLAPPWRACCTDTAR